MNFSLSTIISLLSFLDKKFLITRRRKNDKEVKTHEISNFLDKIHDFCLGAKTSMLYNPHDPDEEHYLHNGKFIQNIQIEEKDLIKLESPDLTIKLSDLKRKIDEINDDIKKMIEYDIDSAIEILCENYPFIVVELISIYKDVSRENSIHVTKRDAEINEIKIFMDKNDVYYNKNHILL